MKNVISLILISFLFLFSRNLPAQDMGQNKDDMQIKWMEYMTPGDMHKMMAEDLGEWKTATKWWMAPGTEPMNSDGGVIVESLFDGRYTQSKHSGIMMGMPFLGINLLGFDNVTKEFTSVWIDNMGTGIAISKGSMDAAARTVNFTGSMVEPMAGGYVNFRQTWKIIDQNTRLLEMFMPMDGEEFKMMEVLYTR